MNVEERILQAYANEDNPPPPPMDPALMASPDDQMLQPAPQGQRVVAPETGGELGFGEYLDQVFTTIGDIPDMAIRGALRGLGETAHTIGLVDDNQITKWRGIMDASSDLAVQQGVNPVAAGFGEGVGQVGAAALPVFKVLRAAGIGRVAAGLIAEGFGGSVAVNPDDPNMGNLAKELLVEPGSNTPFAQAMDLLATNPDDPEIVNRARNAIQDAGLGLAFEGLLKSPDMVRSMVERWKAGKSPIPVGMSIEDVTPKTATPVAHSFKAEEGNPNSIINMLYNTEHGGFPTPPDGGRWNKAKLAEYLEKQATEAGTRIEKFDNAAQETISDRIANEAVAALSREGNASDWYNSKIIEMNETLRQLHPELEDGSVNEGVFKLGLALTSNGTTVGDNLKFAEHVYQVFKDTGKFPNDLSSMEAALGGFGKEGPILVKSFQKANVLIDELGVDGFVEFLNTPITVGELKKMGFGVSKENVGFKTHGSIIFGPKIGAGFYQNLRGNFEPVTFDRWWVASWGRWTGNAINKATDKAQAKQLDRFATAIGKKYDNPEDAINEAHQIFAEYKKNNFQPRTELNKAAQRLSEGATITMREEPGAGGDRAFMRATVQRAVEKLRELGYNVTPADLQATVWYPEKELHGALGIGNGRSAPDDYAAAARRLVEERNAGN